MSFTPDLRSFARLTYFWAVISPSRMDSSISITPMFAPPCFGPHSALTPAETDAYMFAPPEATMRTVDVEQFCSWSACSTRNMLSACATSGVAS